MKLTLQYFGYPMQRTDSLEKKKPWWQERLKARGEVGQKIRCLDSITDSMDMNLRKLQEMVEDKEARHATAHGVAESLQLNNNNNNKNTHERGHPFVTDSCLRTALNS